MVVPVCLSACLSVGLVCLVVCVVMDMVRQTLVVIQAMVTTLTSEGGTLSVFLVVASLFGLV